MKNGDVPWQSVSSPEGNFDESSPREVCHPSEDSSGQCGGPGAMHCGGTILVDEVAILLMTNSLRTGKSMKIVHLVRWFIMIYSTYWQTRDFPVRKPFNLQRQKKGVDSVNHSWLVVYLPLWKIWRRQLGWWFFPIYGTIKFHHKIPWFQSPPSRFNTLWWTNIAMENHHFEWENPLFLWPFSIAMLVHQRVSRRKNTTKNSGFLWSRSSRSSCEAAAPRTGFHLQSDWSWLELVVWHVGHLGAGWFTYFTSMLHHVTSRYWSW